MDDFLKRVCSSIFLFLLFLAAIFTTIWFFFGFFLLVVFYLYYEWQGLILPKVSKSLRMVMSIILIAMVSFFYFMGLNEFVWPTLLATGLIYFWLIKSKLSLSDYSLFLLGVIYIAFFFHSLVSIRFNFDSGKALLFLAFLIVWSVDVGAFFVGKFFQGPKIAPKISPSKTWSGLCGGMFFSTLIVYLALRSFSFEIDQHFVYVIPFIAILAQVGDFFESYLKRRIGVKDSGTIIPGHGGVLDRFDGALLVIPVFYMLLYFYV